MRSWICAFVMMSVVTAAEGWAADAVDDAGNAFFETKIRPVLVEHCQSCHGEKKQRGEFRLDSKASMLKGGESGKAMIPGQAAQSLLVKALRHQDIKMPPTGKLPEAVIADFVKWIDMGAADPRDGSAAPVKKSIDWAAAKTFWSFQTPHKQTPPKVANASWVKGPIDPFILRSSKRRSWLPCRRPANAICCGGRRSTSSDCRRRRKRPRRFCKTRRRALMKRFSSGCWRVLIMGNVGGATGSMSLAMPRIRLIPLA